MKKKNTPLKLLEIVTIAGRRIAIYLDPETKFLITKEMPNR